MHRQVAITSRVTEYFTADLSVVDPQVHAAITKEDERQRSQIELIAPKNYLSNAARRALGSIIGFTSVEGYPGRRWHAGMENLDLIENLAIDRATQLFRCRYANVQLHSGTQANQAVFFALLDPGDTVVSMDLDAGGHLSHGLRTNLSGKWFRVAQYGVRAADGLIDYDEVRAVCREHRPKLLITGGSSYPRTIDFARFREIADEVGAYLLADISHFSALVATSLHPHVFPHCHVVTTATNKNLRGPRGGMVLCDDEALGRRLNAAVFPGIQGGPLPEHIVAKAVSFGEALDPEYGDYARGVVDNARVLCEVLQQRGWDVVTGGTDSPLVMIDLRSKGITGDLAQASLEAAGMPANKNLVPGDPERPTVTSGIRLGTSAVTTRGMREPELRMVGSLLCDVLEGLVERPDGNSDMEKAVAAKVDDLSRAFPIYPLR